MKTPRTRIANVVAERTLKQGSSKEYATELAAYLLSERRTRELDSLLRDIQADWATVGHIEVIATCSHPLTDVAKEDIVRQIRKIYPVAKKIIVTEVRNPELIGGVRISLPGSQLDLSVRGKLNKFKQLTTAGKD